MGARILPFKNHCEKPRNVLIRKALRLKQDAFAKFIVRSLKNRIRFCASRDLLLTWNGEYWEYSKDSGGLVQLITEIKERLQNFLLRDGGGLPDLALSLPSSLFSINSITTLGTKDMRIQVAANKIDANPYLLNTPSGTFDFKTFTLKPFCRDDLITKITPVAPSSNLDCFLGEADLGNDCLGVLFGVAPTISEFLLTISSGDLEWLAFLQKDLGCALSGSLASQRLSFLHGEGANGKSVLIDLICAACGPEYVTRAPTDLLLSSKSGRHPCEMATLQGLKIAFCDEPGEGSWFNETRLKLLTGDKEFRARLMRENDSTYLRTFTLFMVGNHKIAFRSMGESIKRRITLIPFSHVVPESERDPDLLEKMRPELPHFLAWMIAGYARYLQEGMIFPQSIKAATYEWLEEEDTFKTWALERTQFESHARTPIRDFFNDWNERHRFTLGQGGEKRFPSNLRRVVADINPNGKYKVAVGKQEILRLFPGLPDHDNGGGLVYGLRLKRPGSPFDQNQLPESGPKVVCCPRG